MKKAMKVKPIPRTKVGGNRLIKYKKIIGKKNEKQ